MKQAILFVVLCAAVQLWAQDKTLITVKNTEKSNGVIIVTIVEKGKTMDLQCNEVQGFCAAPKPGEYAMLRLPKNHGVYDCQNVDLFPGSEGQEKIGEYCLSEK